MLFITFLKVKEIPGKNLFWSIKNSGEILDKLKARDFTATLPHNLIKDKLIDLIEGKTWEKHKKTWEKHKNIIGKKIKT